MIAGEDSAECGDNSLSMTPEVGPSLTPPTRQTTLVPPVRPFRPGPLGEPGMQCPRFQHENRAQAKFCEECAAPLARACSNCRTPLSPTAKFCPECAHPVAAGTTESRFASPESYTPKHLADKILTSKAALEGERKLVTVLFADLKGARDSDGHTSAAPGATLGRQSSWGRLPRSASRAIRSSLR
jgi:Double zinc ribbon